jgi:hypothetical protein
MLVVGGKGAGYYSRNISAYLVSGAVNSGERQIVLQEDVPAGIDVPDETSVIALFSLGEYRYGVLSRPRAAWVGYIPVIPAYQSMLFDVVLCTELRAAVACFHG